MKIKSIRNIKKFDNKKVILRLDLNVALSNGKITNDFKIRASLETISFLLKRKAKILILSHLGRPTKENKADYSLKPVAKYLKELLGQPVTLVSDLKEAKESNWRDSNVMILENLRFFKEETENSASFAKKLANLANIYVNDAFAVSHRSHVSVDKIKNYLPSYAGFLLEKEVENLNKILKPKKPLLVIMGGSKISSKVPLIKNLEKKSDQILIAGALANTFLYFLGYEIGKSVYEKKAKKDISLFIVRKKLNKKLILPIDLLVKTRDNKVLVRSIDKVRKTDMILDIGPDTIIDFCQRIKKAKTIVWNGPLGMFEDKRFKHGTVTIAIMIASSSSSFSVIGGGETLAAAAETKMSSYINWLSTGGGAMLSYLGKEEMPGLNKIIK